MSNLKLPDPSISIESIVTRVLSGMCCNYRVPFFKPFTVPDTTIASKSLVLLLQLVINNAIKAGKIEYFMVFN